MLVVPGEAVQRFHFKAIDQPPPFGHRRPSATAGPVGLDPEGGGF